MELARPGRLRVQSDPVGARVLIDGLERGVTPLTIDDLSLGAHSVLLDSVEGSVQQTVTIARGHPVDVNTAIYAGWLHVSSPIEVDMSEDGRGILLDERYLVMLPPGSHVMRFENRALGFSAVQTVDVAPGVTTSVLVAPPPSTLSVTATLPAEVQIDDALAGHTPLTDFPVDIGTRDVIVRSADGDERRRTITVTVDPARVDVDFSKP